MDKVGNELKKLDAEQAKALQNNPVWIDVQKKMEEMLHKRRLNCKTATDPEEAADIIRCEQLLNGIYREIKKYVESGKMAEISLAELKKKATAKETPRKFVR